MHRKIIGILLAIVLTLTLCAGCASDGQSKLDMDDSVSEKTQSDQPKSLENPSISEAQPASDDELRYYDDTGYGIRFRMPEVWYIAMNETNSVLIKELEHGFRFDYMTVPARIAMIELLTNPDLPSDEEEMTAEKQKLLDVIQKGTVPLCAFLAEPTGEMDQEIRTQYSDEKILGEAFGTVYTLLSDQGADVSELTDEEKAEYQALLTTVPEFEQDMTLSGIEAISSASE